MESAPPMITLTFAGDESGDVSFAFDKGASRYFVVAVIATAEPDALRQLLTELRQATALPADYEFGFDALSSARLRERVLRRFGKRQLRGLGRGRRQDDTPGSLQSHASVGFLPLLRDRVIRLIPAEKREGATLILDEFGSAGDGAYGASSFHGCPRYFASLQAGSGQTIQK